MKTDIKTQNISTKKLKFVAELFLADLRLSSNLTCELGLKTNSPNQILNYIVALQVHSLRDN